MLELILRMVISMTVTVFVAWLACGLLRRAPAVYRSAVWRSALLVLLAVPLVCLAWDALPAPRCEVTVSLPRVPPAPESLGQPSTAPPEAVPVAAAPALRSTPPDAGSRTAEARRSAISAVPVIFALWVLGAALTVSLVVRDGLTLRRLRRQSTPAAGSELLGRTGHWADRIGLRRPPPVAESAAAQVPVVVGWWRPALVLPQPMPEDHAYVDAVLIHELAHVRRRDVLFQYVAQIARALWWWHPLTWLLLRELTATAEEACDDWVVSLTGDLRAYARSVVRWAEAARTGGVLACGWRGAALTRRIRRVLEGPAVRTLHVPRWAVSCMVATALLVTTVAGAVRARAVPSMPGQALVRMGGPLFSDRECVRILLMGTDTRPGNSPGRSDALLLLSANARTRRVALLGIPRDLKVTIPRQGQGKINHAYPYGGVELTRQCVETLLGQPLDHHLLLTFQGFVEAVDGLGGVWINVPDIEGDGRGLNYDEGVRVSRTQIDQDGHLHLHLKPGIQKLDGAGALGFVRYRKSPGSTDAHRCARQQKFLAALARECSQAEPRQLLAAANGARKHIATDMSWDEVCELLRFLTEADANQLWMGTVPVIYAYEDGGFYARLEESGLQAQLRDMERHLDGSEGSPTRRGLGVLPREQRFIRGRVVLPDGVTPAVGARVTAERLNEGDRRTMPPMVHPSGTGLAALDRAPQTAQDGTFEIPVSEFLRGDWGRYVIRAHFPGYAPTRSAPVAPGGRVEVALQPGHLLRGAVMDHEGRPVPGMRVAAYWPTFRGAAYDTGEAAATETGADGRFELGPLASGEYDIWAKAEDQAPMSAPDVKVPRPEGDELHLRLQAPAEIRGRVVYGQTRQPLGEVEVSLSMGDAGVHRTAQSDGDGRFILRGLRAGEHKLELRRHTPLRLLTRGRFRMKPGEAPVLEAGEVSGGEKYAEGEISLALYEGQILEKAFPIYEGGAVEGRVLTAEGRPVAGADVSLGWAIKMNLPDYTPESFLRTHPVSYRSGKVAETDADGRFRVDHLWPRYYYIEAKAPDGHYGSTEFFEVEDRATARVEVTIADETFPPFPDPPDSVREELWR